MTGIISEDLSSVLEGEKILSEEQKGRKRNSRRIAKDQVLLGKAVNTAKGKVEILQ